MGVWDGVERCKRRHMGSETHQVCEEANHKWLVSWFPHFSSWPPPDNNVTLGPTWCLCTPPTLTNACHFKHEPSNVSLSFCMQACCFECEPIILHASPSFRMWAHHFACEPVVLNMSPSSCMWAHHFKCEPIISHAGLLFWMWACCFKCDPWMTATSITMQPNHGAQATSTVGTMYRGVYKGT